MSGEWCVGEWPLCGWPAEVVPDVPVDPAIVAVSALWRNPAVAAAWRNPAIQAAYGNPAILAVWKGGE